MAGLIRPGMTSREQMERFNAAYKARATNPAFLAIEKKICGCGYGAASWTTQGEADEMLGHLNMGPDTQLLDIGSGAGWPALYFAEQSGCDATLTDLPYEGILIARNRGHKDGMGTRVRAAVASAAELPFGEARFDAVTHSDVLCCLEPKLETLSSCRRVIKPAGKMVFSTIYLNSGLSEAEVAQAKKGAPELVEAPAPYEDMLVQAGWVLNYRASLNDQFRETAVHLKALEEANREELAKVWGDDTDSIIQSRADYVTAIDNNLIGRDLFVVAPA